MPTIAGASRQIAGKFYDKGGGHLNPRHPDYGAKGDAKDVFDGAITTGTPTLTSATAGFTAADVGKAVSVGFAGTPSAGTGTLSAAAGVGTFSTTQTGILGEGSLVIVAGVTYTATAFNAAMTSCTLSGAPTFGAAAFNIAKTLLTTILAFVNGTTVTLAANAGLTVTVQKVNWGTDDTVALQAWIDAGSHSHTLPGTGAKTELPAGKYKITGKLRLKDVCLRCEGAGKEEAIIHYEGVAAGALVSDAIIYNKLRLEHFGIIGDATSGKGIDLSATTSQSFLCTFRELNILAGAQAMHIPNCFSSIFDTVFASSVTNHAFQVSCGPSVSWIDCYAGSVPAGKAGYRLTGGIRMYTCNGVNSGGYWGIFGNDTTAADGFQTDFSTTTYPDAVLEGCNVEAFSTTGIYLQAPFTKFEMNGGAFTRALAGSYHSLLRVLRGPNGASNYIVLDSVRALISGGASTASPIYSDAFDYLVVKGAMSLLPGITGMYSATFGAVRPAINILGIGDTYQDTALYVSAQQSARLTAVNSLNIGAAGGVGGLNGAGAVSSAKFVKRVTGIANAVATTVLTSTILNVATSALVRVTLTGSLGAGGAIGANEATGSVSYDIAITRTVGVNAVAVATAAITGASAVVAGGNTITVTAALAAMSGAVGATNTVALQVTISRGGSTSTNHTCLVLAEVLNANAQGVVIS